MGQTLRRLIAGTGKKLSLELGGKSPVIVFESADLTDHSILGGSDTEASYSWHREEVVTRARWEISRDCI